LTFVDEILKTKKAIPTNLILQRKLNPVKQAIWYKARLVAQGFREVEGLDLRDTFTPVASLASVLFCYRLRQQRVWQYVKWI